MVGQYFKPFKISV